MRTALLCLVVAGLAMGLWVILTGCSKEEEDRGQATPQESPGSVAWADIEETLREEPDPVAEQTLEELRQMKFTPNFEDAPLDTFARFLSKLSQLEVAVLPRTWEEFSKPELWVTMKSEEVSLAKALDLICTEKGLAWWVEGKKVNIAPTPPRTEVVDIVYPIANLTTGENIVEPDAIADLIRDRTDQEVWEEDGEVVYRGPGKGLLVAAPKATQRKVLTLLRDLLKRESTKGGEPDER